jgi:hypothetical protein
MQLLVFSASTILICEGLVRFKYELRKFDDPWADAEVFSLIGAFVEFAVGLCLLGSAIQSGVT